MKDYSHKIENEPELLYVSVPIRGERSVIVNKETLEFLYANSSIGYTRHLEEYKKGRRRFL